MKPIGYAVVEGQREVPIYNPGFVPESVPYVILEEGITEHQLDANRKGTLNRSGGLRRVHVNKQTRNGEAAFMIY